MLTKPTEAPCSLFLIWQGLPSSFPKVFTKYNHVSLVEMKQITDFTGFCFFLFFCLFLFF